MQTMWLYNMIHINERQIDYTMLKCAVYITKQHEGLYKHIYMRDFGRIRGTSSLLEATQTLDNILHIILIPLATVRSCRVRSPLRELMLARCPIHHRRGFI
jgi:hypothetical protein